MGKQNASKLKACPTCAGRGWRTIAVPRFEPGGWPAALATPTPSTVRRIVDTQSHIVTQECLACGHKRGLGRSWQANSLQYARTNFSGDDLLEVAGYIRQWEFIEDKEGGGQWEKRRDDL